MTPEPDTYLVERLREALAKDARVNELELDVAVAAGKVFVSGTVETQARRDAVTQVARELLPEREIVNQTSVLSVKPEPDAERIS